ncbi:MAG: efflux RND transporter permease subunit, partial [Calditrichia bacterium]|nr:efflux RND transporter permease subunit [Calditrichia bacterium]
MLVDNSIVVLESIFRCQEEGDDLITSVVRGVSEVGTAVMASTLTTIAVFFPMVFVQGIAGQIFGNLALTVVFSLLASLMVALFVIPMTASLRFKTFNAVTGIEKKSSWKKLIKVFISYTQVKEYFNNRIDDFKNNKLPFKVYLKLFADIYWIIRTILFGSIELAGRIISAIFMGFSLIIILFSALIKRLIEVVAIQWLGGPFNKILNYVSEKYTQLIEQALEKKKVVISLAFASFLITVFLILPRLGSELIPEVHQGEFYVDLIYPIGTPVEKTAELVNQFEEEIRQLPLVEKVATVVGSDMTNVKNIEEGEHTSRLTVRLKQHSNLEKAEEETIVTIRNLLKDVPGVKNSIARPVLFSFKTPVEIIIKGYHLEELLRVSRLAQHELSEIPGLQDVKTNLQSGNPEVRIAYDRQKLAFYNLDIQTVAAVVRNKIRGDVATEFKEEDRRIDILVRIKESDRKNLSHLQRININSNGDKPIPLNAVALIKVEEGPSEIRRINQERAVVIGANISGRSLSDVSADIYQILQQMELPADFTFEISGQNKEMEVSLNSLKLALLLAIFLVYIVMASQFESF